MINGILIVILVVIVGAAITYIIREKKRGVKCIGCPYAQQCGKSGKANNECGIPEDNATIK